MRGFERGRQKGTPKRRYFAVIGSPTVKTLEIGTDMLHIVTSTGDKFFRFINIDDIE